MGNDSTSANHSQVLARAKRHGARAPRSRRYFIGALSLSVLSAGVWITREPLLRGAADLWIVSDAITPADAVVVLGGGINTRPFEAAALYAKNLVKKVLLSEVEKGRSVGIGAIVGHTEFNRTILLRMGVPDSAIETFGTGNKNTWEEAVALKGWEDRNPVSVLIIPSEIFAARRVRWAFRRVFSGTAVRIEVPSADPKTGYTRANWWKSEEGAITFQNEVLKYLYYRWKY
jgi:hypothetical protein